MIHKDMHTHTRIVLSVQSMSKTLSFLILWIYRLCPVNPYSLCVYTSAFILFLNKYV